MRKIAACLIASTVAAHAGSPYLGYTIDRLEIVNDGPSELAILCYGQAFDSGNPSYLIGKCRLDFARKYNANWTFLWSGQPQWFHSLQHVSGAPVMVGNIWDDGHHTTTSGWLAWTMPTGAGISAGDPAFLVANGPIAGQPNVNWVYIDCRSC